MTPVKNSPSESSKRSSGKGASGKPYEKNSRCWPGYVPVPGKGEHQEGSCRKAPASKNGGKEVDRETARKQQISIGGQRAEAAKSKSPDATERKPVKSAAKNKAAAKTAAKKTPAKKKAA